MTKLTEADIERAVDYLRDSAEATAQARANRVYLEEYRKSLKAMLMKKFEGTAVAQEREAYAHEDYVAHLKAIQVAVFDEQKALFLREAALAKIEWWRTSSANYRGMARAAA